jgi:alkanesulfonate monooxygenase SsuD/methylene tetrahydromethanopterin reductase-like flavin-dependent oxidoreductase (luciferase family)
VKFALNLPNFGNFSDINALVELAVEAETAGWDGFFLWDHILADEGVPFVDPWIAMTAIACATRRIRIGTMVTPIPRRRPWKLAREAVTLDHLSNGRLILGVGIGGDGWREYSAFGEDPDQKRHGEMLDEGLGVLTGLWSGEPFSFSGQHYVIDNATFLPRPIQEPRIPIWTSGMWPTKKPFRRAAKWDGVFPLGKEQDLLPEDIRAMRAYIDEHRESSEPYDVAVNGRVFAPDFTEEPVRARDHADAGVTWWVDAYWGNVPMERVRRGIRQGPPG